MFSFYLQSGLSETLLYSFGHCHLFLNSLAKLVHHVMLFLTGLLLIFFFFYFFPRGEKKGVQKKRRTAFSRSCLDSILIPGYSEFYFMELSTGTHDHAAFDRRFRTFICIIFLSLVLLYQDIYVNKQSFFFNRLVKFHSRISYKKRTREFTSKDCVVISPNLARTSDR